MEKNKIYNRKNERGAITLFVLIACLFFALILTGVYVSTLNKMQAQEQQIDQVQENYARQLENIDEIYKELSKSIQVQLKQEPGNGTWTKEVTLTGIGKIEEESNVTIVGYAFSKDSTDESKLNWSNLNNVIETTQSMKVIENGTYYFWVKDSEGEIHQSNSVEVTNIDKTSPTAGSIIAKEENAEGEEYDLEKSPWTDESVYIEKVDGTDGESGHGETTYTVKKDGITIHENIKDPVVLEESGIYEIVVTTKDQAGNEATSEPYEIKIDKVVPVLALKHNDENGENYDGTWTKDDLYGEINIDTSKTGKSVEKYQYSYNGVIWNDISSEIVPISIDYTTTFPMAEDKPEWINGPVNNGTYYFETQEDGTLKPTNGESTGSTNKNTVANSYFEIDLTEYPESELQITINATISSENNYDFGYATITTSETAPAYNSSTGRFIYVSGTTKTQDYTTTLEGGQKYYLHIGYRKDSSGSSNQDTFIINSIRLQSETLGSNINFTEYKKEGNKITFKLQEDVEREIYVRAVYTDGTTSKYGNKTTIKIDKTAPVIESSNIEIISKTEAKANIKVKEELSGMKGYYVSTDNIEPTETSNWVEQISKEFTIEGLKTNTTYYLWIIDNVANISQKQEVVIGNVNYQIDGNKATETLEEAIEKASDGSTIELLNDYTDTSAATFSKNITFDVQGYTLTRDKTITINSGKEVEITGTGKITSGTNSVRTITNSGTLTISNSVTIENMSTSSSYAPIYTSSSSSITNINDNVQIIGYYRGIYNYYGTVNINGGKIEATYQGSSAYGIYNYSRTTVKTCVNSGEIKGYYGIYNGSSSTLEITGGKIIGTGAYGIYAYGTTNIYGGRIEGKTYGVYSNNTDKVTIGREEDELSTTQPAIYGANYGIYMSDETYIFNFYNGVIISNTRETAYRGQANLRTGHITYTYIDYEIEQKYCTILTPTVGNIEMKSEPTEYTNQNVTVTIRYPYTQGITREYSEDGTEWKQAEQYIQEVMVEENKTIYARTIDEFGIITEERQLEVTNIDKEKPTVEVTPTKTKYTVIETDGTVDLNITIKVQDTGVSGLDKVQYAWIEEGETPEYTDFTKEITINQENLKIKTYYLYINVTDKAGNKADLEQIRYTVEYQEPVAQIGNTKYLTIQEAIEACSKTTGDTQTTIEILKSTDEEFVTYEGQNIILDLKGYTIGSSNPNTPICTNNGILQIIDTSTEKIGKLEDLNGTAIENKGTLTIGNNSTEIEMEVPTIYGKQIGIKNEGTFNFYDGKIQGTAPIQGNVTHTPDQYGPVSTGYENGITTIQLGIVSGYEARIEWVYYTTVQGAIDDTKLYQNSEDRDIVTLIKDIQLKEIIEIKELKNFILDLNGYELFITEQDRVINNYGNLEILDNSIEKTGMIKIESINVCYGIYNNAGKILVAEGNITSNSNYSSYGIFNKGDANIEFAGGTINSNSGMSYSSYGIYNQSTGIIKLSGGTININKNTSGASYGIYNYSIGSVFIESGVVNINKNNSSSISNYAICNNSTGSIIMTGGIIKSNYDNNNSYGIYNRSSGKVTVIGGEIIDNGYGIYNVDVGTIEMHGGVIKTSNSYSTYGIYNNKSGDVIITAGTVIITNKKYSAYGLYNRGEGTIEVLGGNIEGITYSDTISSYYNGFGIYNIIGTIIVGDKNALLDKESIVVNGKYSGTKSDSLFGYGIYNEQGNVEFYNGKIEGNIALLGTVSRVRENYKIISEIADDREMIYLAEKTNEEYIAQIDNVKYKNLQEAIDSIEENQEKTIEILKDIELEDSIIFNKDIILDLKGKTITNKYFKIENRNNLKIIDTSYEQTGNIENINTVIGILNSENGVITIESGIISSIGNKDYRSYGIYNQGTGEVKITGGTIICNSFYTGAAIYNANIGKVKLIEGLINASSEYISGIENSGTGTIEIIGGTISASGGNSKGVYNNGKGNVKMIDGIIKSSGRVYGQGIYNSSSGMVEISGGILEINSKMLSYGIYNSSSTGVITITGGKLTSNSNSYNAYGIYNNQGSIIIGEKEDGIVSQEEPYIYGEYTGTSSSYVGYGIYNTEGKLYYYDGRLQGSTKAVYDIITEKEDNTELNYNENETILTLTTTITPVAQIGSDIYNTLEEAINSVQDKETIIKILRNISYTKNDNVINIPKEKSIVLDLNGYKITSAISGQTIINEGKLEIIDTSEEKTGIIITSEETTIRNLAEAELIISGGTLENRKQQCIYNEGKIKVTDGIIINSNENNDEYIFGIYNINTGIIEITGGTITSNNNWISYGIYNTSTEAIKITGGIISAYSTYDNSYGIYNANVGNINITGGRIIAGRKNLSNINTTTYGIYNQSTGLVTVGIKGDEQIYQEEPYIIGENKMLTANGYGIYNPNGKLHYYDGKLIGKTKGISGEITEIENGAELNITIGIIENIENEVITLKQETGNVAKVNEKEYDSMQKAVQACGQTTENIIEVLRDIGPRETIIIEEGQNITIDLKGYVVSNYTEIQNKGTLKIVDSSAEKNGKISNEYGIAISNSGTMIVQSGGISDSGYGIQNSGTLNITEGNITNNTYGIYNTGSGITTITGGDINTNTYGVYNYSGTVDIETEGITNNDYGIYNLGGTTNIKEGAELQSNIGIYNANGRLNIGEQGSMNANSPIITGETYGLVNSATGITYMYDGQVRGKEGATQGYITYTESGYAVANKIEREYNIDYLVLAGTIETVAEVNGIAFSNLQSAINSVIGEKAQTVKLTNGVILNSTLHIAEGQNIILDMNEKTISSNIDITIQNEGNLTIIDSTSSGVGKISSTVGVAIENSETLTLGQDDGLVSQDLITIEGNTYGIVNSGTLNFYDGTINGASAIQGVITNRPEGYVIRITTVNGKERYYLST